MSYPHRITETALATTYATLAPARSAPVPARAIATALDTCTLAVVQAARAARSRDDRVVVRAIPGVGIAIALPA